MAKDRKSIPQKIADQVLVANRHLCCICNTEGREVVIHHIDGDTTNNDLSNLCVLCLLHHGEVHKTPGLGRKYTPEALEAYKDRWEEHCKLDVTKKKVVNKFFIMSTKVPQLSIPEIIQPFMSDVSSSGSFDSLNASIINTGLKIQKFTGGETSSDDFVAFILKGTDESGEEA